MTRPALEWYHRPYQLAAFRAGLLVGQLPWLVVVYCWAVCR